jgi:hypothetical protein
VAHVQRRGQAKFSFLGVKLEARKADRKEGRKMIKAEEEEEEAEFEMVSKISFIYANLQHGIAASRVFTRIVVIKGIWL